MANLTPLERRVFAALKENAENESGGDFGLMERVSYRKLGLNGQQFGGVVTSLQGKGVISVHEPVETNGGPRRGGERWTQFTIETEQN